MRNGFLDNNPDIWDGEPRKRPKKPPAVSLRKTKQRVQAGTAPVMYVKVRCPKCRSDKVPVYDSKHLPIRYHKCSVCGLNFKSLDLNYLKDKKG
jgi:transposase-like protein